MSQAQRPDRHQVRDWLKREVDAKRAPPTPDQIKRELGWHMCEDEREAVKRVKGEWE